MMTDQDRDRDRDNDRGEVPDPSLRRPVEDETDVEGHRGPAPRVDDDDDVEGHFSAIRSTGSKGE